MRPAFLVSLALCAAIPPASSASDVFGHWAIACDNTRRCQASGTQVPDSASPPVALLLTRAAGPAAAIEATVLLDLPGGEDVGPITISVGTQRLPDVAIDTPLAAEQFARLLPQLLQAPQAQLSDGKHRWTLSLSGLKAALLKMDDVQGRLDTRGALIRKGARPDTAALPPLPVPRLVAAPLPPTTAKDEQLLARIIDAIGPNDCGDALEDAASEDRLHRLSSTQLLVQRLCARGAYQSSYAFWIASARPPHAPRQVAFESAGQHRETELANAEFSDGILFSYAKGRGVGDCGRGASWVWTAEGFKLLEANWAPQCNGMAGGVPLRTWVAELAGARQPKQPSQP